MVATDHLGHERAWLDAHGLVYHPALLRVVTHLDVADEREVLAEGMTDEAVVGEDSTQVRMSLEEDAEEVEGLALVPVRARPHVDDGGHERLIGVRTGRAQSQTLVVSDGEQVIDDG